MMAGNTLSDSLSHSGRGTGHSTRRRIAIRITPLHMAVRGRARFHLNLAYRQPLFTQHLIDQLNAMDGIISVQASSVTGNVTIRFIPGEINMDVNSLIRMSARRSLRRLVYRHESHGQAVAGNGYAIKETINTLLKYNATDTGKTPSREIKPAKTPVTRTDWHTRSGEGVIRLIDSSADVGLTTEEAMRRLRHYGPNELPKLAERSDLEILMEQFLSVPVGLLAASAVVSIVTGGMVDALAIMSVVFINAGIGFVTERQAERTIESLTKTTPRFASVIRNGNSRKIAHSQVVVGDLLQLNPGDFVAADARIIRSHRLTVDESALTGESLPATKSDSFTGDAKTPLADRINMVHMGTMVTGGSARAVVVASGRHTELGEIQSMVGAAQPPDTPMQQQLRHLGARLAVVSSVICASVFFIGLLRGQSVLQMLKSAISLAVAAVPEGLPTVATSTLALGIRKMHQQHVAIRHLNAVETLGAVQVFCLDKTGTLTLNRMSVVALQVGTENVVVSGNHFIVNSEVINPKSRRGFRQMLKVISLCNEAVVSGDTSPQTGSPTEKALFELASNAGIDIASLHRELPRFKIRYRSQDRPYMCTCHRQSDTEQLVAVKGSPHRVLELCRYYFVDNRIKELTEAVRADILAANDNMAGDALRVLGVAYAIQPMDIDNVYHDLTWLGLTGMIDPLRTGMADLIHTFHVAGIQTVMITGDQSATAYAIGRQLKLNRDKPLQILDSTRLDILDPELLKGVIEQVHVFARVSPAHKLQIVQALQQSGKVVAMTGDGINDGPALKAADIGVAMGGATADVARSVSDVVLEDDNLHTMITAVHEGRMIYSNIRKSIHYLVSTNLSEIELMLSGITLGLGQPLNPMQLLWINLFTDVFPGLALSMEAPEPDLMHRAPRERDEQIIRIKDLKRMLHESAIITSGSLAGYAYALLRYGPGAKANTIAFNSITLAQLLHAYSCRSDRYSIYDKAKLPTNPYLTYAIGGSLSLQLLAMLPGIRRFLGTVSVGLIDALVMSAGATAPLLINEAIKQTNGSLMWKNRFNNEPLQTVTPETNHPAAFTETAHNPGAPAHNTEEH